QTFSSISSPTTDLIQKVKDYTLRPGKRIRPVLCIKGYECAGLKSDSDIVLASISFELLQSYLLIHDDLMDNSSTRRGEPSFHYLFHKPVPQQDSLTLRLGENQAIIGGDLLQSFAFDAILESGFSPQVKSHALKHLIYINEFTAIGQELDLLLSSQNEFTEADVLKVHEFKTAKYTIEGPLLLGAILAQAPPKVLAQLSAYAVPIGIAFQIHDDILGLMGSEEKTGKSVSSDLSEGKKTLLILKALQESNASERKTVFSALGNPKVTPAQVARVREIVQKTGSLEYSQELSRQFAQKSLNALEASGLSFSSKKFLMELAHYLIAREH
ncbi:MAG: polyprenyl synthetase family protein, partial [Candidatus Diapherotrites archaeon]|nr:polyprenyl synthetase family protein [Candidatus Diapherotrites archaeon]